jgi:hypothetical protein
MAKKIVLYSLALVNLAITYFTATAVAAMPEHSIFYNDSLWILAAFILGIALFIFAPIWIAAALVLYAHDSL